MKYASTFIVALLVVTALALIIRSASLSSESAALGDANVGDSRERSGPDRNLKDPPGHSGQGEGPHKLGQAQPLAKDPASNHVAHDKVDPPARTNAPNADTGIGGGTNGAPIPDSSGLVRENPGQAREQPSPALDEALSSIQKGDLPIASRMAFAVAERDGLTFLNNTLDPITGRVIGSDPILLDYYGFQIRFADERSVAEFRNNEFRFLCRLSLEYLGPSSVKFVNAASFPIRRVETCFSMGGEIDYSDDVFLLHRGYKFYFCCWPPHGCGQDFLDNPGEAYGHYGLRDEGGTLVEIDLRTDARSNHE
jgi:hypothetical protein